MPIPCRRAMPGEELFESFHRFVPRRVIRYRIRRMMPRVVVHLGLLRGLIYSSDRGCPGRPRNYIHFLRTPPRLACDQEGRQLFILGGRYRVTRLGIEG